MPAPVPLALFLAASQLLRASVRSLLLKELHVDDVSCAVQDTQKLRACFVAISLPAHKSNRYVWAQERQSEAVH